MAGCRAPANISLKETSHGPPCQSQASNEALLGVILNKPKDRSGCPRKLLEGSVTQSSLPSESLPQFGCQCWAGTSHPCRAVSRRRRGTCGYEAWSGLIWADLSCPGQVLSAVLLSPGWPPLWESQVPLPNPDLWPVGTTPCLSPAGASLLQARCPPASLSPCPSAAALMPCPPVSRNQLFSSFFFFSWEDSG